MSFGSITPAWVLVGDSVINQYHEGRMSLGYAEKKLDDLGAPQSMKNRLYQTPPDKDKNKDEQ